MEEIKVGDVFVGTWGYSMIIPSFFIVVKVTEKRVKVRELKKDSAGMQGYEFPSVPYKVDDSEPLHTCRVDGGAIVVPLSRSTHIYAHRWDGAGVYADYMD
jgi:hypothetical protein